MRIGFTGHRPNRLHIGTARVAARLREALEHVRSDRDSSDRGAPLIAISPLAEGSDRMFAEEALALGMRLHVLLPMPVGDYVQTFEDSATTAVFRGLMARAEKAVVLPGTLTDFETAYHALGRAMVDDCDVLVCVWDGKPAAGKGGTPEVIEYALETGRPVIWIDASIDRPVMRLRAIKPSIDAVLLS